MMQSMSMSDSSSTDMTSPIPAISAVVVDSVDAVTITSAKVKTRRKVVSVACVPCRRGKLGCDHARPCKQCVLRDRSDTCVDPPAEDIAAAKERRKRRRKVVNSQTTSPSQSSSSVRSPVAATRYQIDKRYSLAMLSAFNTAQFRLRLAEWENTRRDSLAERRAHLVLACLADQMCAQDFTALMSYLFPKETLAHTSYLHGWYDVETRPLLLDWKTTVSSAQEIPLDPADVNSSLIDVPAVQFRFGVNVRAQLGRWERQRDAGRQQMNIAAAAPADVSVAQLIDMISCMGVTDGDSPNEAQDDSINDRTNRSHASWCATNDDDVVSAVCTCAAAFAIDATFTVNSAFEKFFGRSQSDVRQSVMADGLKCQYGWMTRASWYGMQHLIGKGVFTEAFYQAGPDAAASTFVVVVDANRNEHDCITRKQIRVSNGISSYVQTFTPVEGAIAHTAVLQGSNIYT